MLNMRMTQITAVVKGSITVVYGLGSDNKMYRWDVDTATWKPYDMEIVG